MVNRVTVSEMDVEYLNIIRSNVENFMIYASDNYAKKKGRLLDIAPQDHRGASPFFDQFISVSTFDIDPKSGCDFIGDICTLNEAIADNSFDYIVCTEVLEHVLQPFDAASEIWRMLKPDGFLFLSTPFNFRIHGPLPDCWRFTEHGLRQLLKQFLIVELKGIETPNRALMPISYTVVARKEGMIY